MTGKGICNLCEKEYSRAGIVRHLSNCMKGQAPAGETSLCHLLMVTTRWRSDYWLALQVSAITTLKVLDQFLRDTWLECCGHLSAYYLASRELGMSRKVEMVFVAGYTIDYEYDMGDTTSLRIKPAGIFYAEIRRKPVRILARNLPPFIPCDRCRTSQAEIINSNSDDYENRWFCSPCAIKLGINEEECLPVVNSPRTGVCGYGG